MAKFLHQLPDVAELFNVIARERQVLPLIVEKDYWIMHCLWGLQQQGFQFELKGGTSLSKGFGLIDRFSEDIDIQIHPNNTTVRTGKNHDKPAHVASRRQFFDDIAMTLTVPSLKFQRDDSFDDTSKMRSAGIRAEYHSLFTPVQAIKEGVLLELGFDQTAPNMPCDISAWAYDKIISLGESVIDNRAKQIPCYCPEYTFVEKLQTISTKYRLQQQSKQMPINFLRHYYDVYKLLENNRVLNFIGTEAYQQHKCRRFRQADEIKISNNPAFTLADKKIRAAYSKAFVQKSAMYFKNQPSFEAILTRIADYIEQL
ncbi:MAG: nucleotidyl transferase AbiEii/AbiGii toxin family protein [Pseudomonadota bacterium]